MAIPLLASFSAKNPNPPPGGRCKYPGQSVRALPIRIVTVGKKRQKGVQLIVEDYIEKLKNYCGVEDVQIRSNPKNARDVMAQIEHEDLALMNLIKPGDWGTWSKHLWEQFIPPQISALAWRIVLDQIATQSKLQNRGLKCASRCEICVIMLDERGLEVGSEQLAELIGDAGQTRASSLLFCIGGPYGHGRQLRDRANVSIKLSSLVLNHQVALVVLVEQLYRAWTILKGQKYHH